ncbi:MAG: siderophore biosynthesis protein [Saprospiraceae bacterium]|nr:MAG: siderophore biosynthesis protein [Saprospiraceae bacterium]
MPLFLHQHLEPEGELGLWRINETEEWFLDRLLLYPGELRQLSSIKGKKRIEWLAVRQLVHQMSGREKRGAFVKDEFGKPYLDLADWYISISHSHNLAAAIASPVSIGIDIQFLVGKIERIAHKYMRPEEMQNLGQANRLEQLHIYWGAKEAIFKAYGRRELEFKKNIFIQPFSFDLETGICYGQIYKDSLIQDYKIHYRQVEDYMLVYVLENNHQRQSI